MKNKNFIIVGGSYGIGFGIVQQLSQAGANVTVLSRTPVVAELPNVSHVSIDVVKDELEGALLPDVIDGLAYCPGSISLGPLRGLKLEQMREDFELNVISAIKCIQASLVGLKASDSSSIVLFSTVAVTQGLAMHSAVSAAKGAIEGLSRSLAAELAPQVRVNCIAPSLTDTPLASKLLANEQKKAAMDARHPLKRVGTVADISSMATYLLSDAATWITGQVIGVDGGMSSVRS